MNITWTHPLKNLTNTKFPSHKNTLLIVRNVGFINMAFLNSSVNVKRCIMIFSQLHLNLLRNEQYYTTPAADLLLRDALFDKSLQAPNTYKHF